MSKPTFSLLDHYGIEFTAGNDVAAEDYERLLDAFISEKNVDLVADVLRAWNQKGITEDELFGFAAILRSRMKRVDAHGLECVDIVGTGGSKVKTFNVSTAAAFVVAGSGIPVAKHGNRAATSTSGSADVLTTLGIDVDVEPEQAERDLAEFGICFMFAPRHHSLSPTLAAARRSLGEPTIFNCVGPLCNPAGAPFQLIGVFDAKLRVTMANVLSRLGTKHSWIVNNIGSLDEIGLKGVTRVVDVDADGVRTVEVTARDFGIDDEGDIPLDLSALESASLIIDLLDNSAVGSPSERLVLMNAAAAINVTGRSLDLKEAYSIAEQSVRSGAAFDKLAALRESRK